VTFYADRKINKAFFTRKSTDQDNHASSNNLYNVILFMRLKYSKEITQTVKEEGNTNPGLQGVTTLKQTEESSHSAFLLVNDNNF